MKLTLALILALFAAPAFANGDPAPDTGCKGCGPDKPTPEPEPEPTPEPRDPSDPDRGGDTVPATAPGFYCILDGELVNFRNAVGPLPKRGDLVRVCPWYAHK